MSADTVKSIAERRVRRQKIFIAVGSVLLLGILGFELPKIMGGKGNQAAPPSPVASVAGAVPGAPASPVVPAGQLPGTDRVVVQRDSNQLISFGLFKSKDPFVQQLGTTPSSPSPSPSPTPIPAPSTPPTSTNPTASPNPSVPLVPPSSPPATSTPASPSSPPVVPTGSTTPSTPTAPPAVPTEALIATNGVCERIAVKGTFPAQQNIFRLVAIAKDGKSVQVGIVGGSFDSGQPTATLKLGDKLTLVNTADGTRYVIELKAKCANIDAQSGGTQTTTSPSAPASTTPVAPAPAPTTTTTTTTDTVTTPIVTDATDTTPPSS